MPGVNARPEGRGVLSALDRAFDRLVTVLGYLAGGILLFMGASVFYEVFMRYLFNNPTRWVVEFSEYMLLYMALLAGAWVLQRDGHVKVEMLVEVLPRKAQAVLHTVTSWVGAAVCALFFWYSAFLVLEQFQTGELLFRAVHVPKWTILVSLPIGLFLLTVQFIRRSFSFTDGVDKDPGIGL